MKKMFTSQCSRKAAAPATQKMHAPDYLKFLRDFSGGLARFCFSGVFTHAPP
jgi:hypothetical protein